MSDEVEVGSVWTVSVQPGIGVGYGSIPAGEEVTVQELNDSVSPFDPEDVTTYVIFDYLDEAAQGKTPVYRRVSLEESQFLQWMTPAAVSLTMLVVPDAENPLNVTVSVYGAPNGDAVTVDFGDGNTSDEAPAANPVEFTHTYAVSGNYTLVATGQPSGSRVTQDYLVTDVPATLTVDVVPDEASGGGCLVRLNGASGATGAGLAKISWGDGSAAPSSQDTFDDTGTLATKLFHRFPATGPYRVEVANAGTAEWGFAVVEVSEEPPTKLDVTCDSGTFEAGMAYDITVSGLTPNVDWTFDFGLGDEPVDMGPVPVDQAGRAIVHTEAYTQPGNYVATATQGDLVGSLPITVTAESGGGSLIVVPTVDENAPLSVQVTVQGAANGQTVTVDWGDASSPDTQKQSGSAELLFTHVYAEPGTYTITVTTDAGGTGTAEVTVDDDEVITPLSVVAVGGTETPQHYVVTVNDAKLGDTVNLAWGDNSAGDTSRDPFDPTKGTTFTHTYTVGGEFVIAVYASPSERKGSTTVNVPDPVEPMDIVIEPDEDGEDGGGMVSIPWRAGPDTDDVSVTIDWGDGTEPYALDLPPFDAAADVTGVAVYHRYATAGDYTVTLTNADGTGGTGSVTVASDAPADITVTGSGTATTDAPDTDLDASGLMPGVTANVDYGDGSPATSAEPSVLDPGTVEIPDYQYETAGDYTVTVTQTDRTGTLAVTVSDPGA
ncbi:PKD domain-containing protein [Streptomyces sp. NBC_00470]|uniref:PKD domain-containing protein n=1 Tax=Streptomyces sp. NBC_00470 TaxID=2975753 RepID=UPI00324493A3